MYSVLRGNKKTDMFLCWIEPLEYEHLLEIFFYLISWFVRYKVNMKLSFCCKIEYCIFLIVVSQISYRICLLQFDDFEVLFMDYIEHGFVVYYRNVPSHIEEVFRLFWESLFDLLELLVLLREDQGEQMLLFWLHYINYNINTRFITTWGFPTFSIEPACLGRVGSCCRIDLTCSSCLRLRDNHLYR